MTAKNDAEQAAELQGRVDALQAELAKQPERVKARVALEREAAKILGESERFDALTDREIKAKVVGAVYPSLALGSDVPDATVDGAYMTAVATAKDRPSSGFVAAHKAAVGAGRADGKSAHERMIDNQANAWKGKDK